MIPKFIKALYVCSNRRVVVILNFAKTTIYNRLEFLMIERRKYCKIIFCAQLRRLQIALLLI